jgi:hypothetical protein
MPADSRHSRYRAAFTIDAPKIDDLECGTCGATTRGKRNIKLSGWGRF